ncbi:hypothetical protein IF1G_01964 [Cordyceps javanica]|uniref:Uncharacterized protein n=1 Tax=Cordyceps javanica TaxID=43265 RepID=A0A545VDP4_9HYPO|nr:hypothetical protein IF1G_01964 [Cordyceps javanica]TQW01364.1 hypothetical protein IF2G_11116 [Cordyceps javanica]TQW10580.1 hypothetical protein IF2G_01522 [Cordyceps javanica]
MEPSFDMGEKARGPVSRNTRATPPKKKSRGEREERDSGKGTLDDSANDKLRWENKSEGKKEKTSRNKNTEKARSGALGPMGRCKGGVLARWLMPALVSVWDSCDGDVKAKRRGKGRK